MELNVEQLRAAIDKVWDESILQQLIAYVRSLGQQAAAGTTPPGS